MFLLLMGSIVNVRFYCNMYQKSKITMQILTIFIPELHHQFTYMHWFCSWSFNNSKVYGLYKDLQWSLAYYCPALCWITITSPSFQCQLLWTLADLQPWSESSFLGRKTASTWIFWRDNAPRTTGNVFSLESSKWAAALVQRKSQKTHFLSLHREITLQ